MRIGSGPDVVMWQDIDFGKNYIVVRRNIPHHRQVETTKTAASQRRVDMSPELAAEFKRLRAGRLKAAHADGKPFDAEEWVFRTEDGTPIHYTNFLRRVWQKVQDLANVRRRTPHERHTFASLLIQNSEPLAYVKEHLGHSSIKMTVDVCGHLVPGANRQAVNRLPALDGLQAAERA
jgi:integrase